MSAPVNAHPWDEQVDQLIRRGRSPGEQIVQGLARTQEPTLGTQGAARLRESLHARSLGFGPLEELVARPGVTDILVNGDGSVWVDGESGTRREESLSVEAAQVRELAVRLAAAAGRRLDEAAPWVDGVLASGVRLHAILPPLAADGPHLSLRIPRQHGADLEQLAQTGMLTDAECAQLRQIVLHRRSFLISGGTGSGKTTLLAAMLAEVPHHERTLIVEDVAELVVAHPHTVRLQSRTANVEGVGQVDMATLIRQALRMRPDRLVVGEVRGPEVREMLQALNTGHEGGGATIHANAVPDLPARLLALGALAGLSDAAVLTQARAAIEVVIHLTRSHGRRRIECIEEARQLWG